MQKTGMPSAIYLDLNNREREQIFSSPPLGKQSEGRRRRKCSILREKGYLEAQNFAGEFGQVMAVFQLVAIAIRIFYESTMAREQADVFADLANLDVTGTA